MAKRFTDTELWQKEWFSNLNLKEKILLKFIFENCDCAGVWEVNYKLASFLIGENITGTDIDNINNQKAQFEFLDEKHIFVKNFIKFQYGTLSENCKPHKPVIEKLKKYNLYERVLKGYPKGIETLEEKEKEQYKEKEKDISSLVLSSLEAEQHNPEKKESDQRLYGKYNNVCMSAEQYNRLLGICCSQKLLDELVDNLSANIEEGREAPFKADFPNAHFIRIEKYREYRMKNPDKFKSKAIKTTSEVKSPECLVRYARHAEECKKNPVSSDYVAKLKAQFMQQHAT